MRTLKNTCRATKIAVYDKYGYMPPMSWNIDLVLDVNSSFNSLVRTGKAMFPIELLTGKPLERLRGLRGFPWGSVVLTKPPKKNEAASINVPKADYSVVVRRMWDRSGVLKVYQIVSGKYAYRLQAKKVAMVPEWVLNKLQNLNPSAVLGYEDDYNDEIFKDLSANQIDAFENDADNPELPGLEQLSDLLESESVDKEQVRELIQEVLIVSINYKCSITGSLRISTQHNQQLH